MNILIFKHLYGIIIKHNTGKDVFLVGNKEMSQLRKQAIAQSRQRNQFMMQKAKEQRKNEDETETQPMSAAQKWPDMDDLCFEHCEYRVSER